MGCKILKILIPLLLVSFPGFGQSGLLRHYRSLNDSISKLAEARTGVRTKLSVKTVRSSNGMLDFIFTETLGDIPWKKEDISWFKTVLKDLAPSGYRNCKVGSIYCREIQGHLTGTDGPWQTRRPGIPGRWSGRKAHRNSAEACLTDI